VSSTPTPNPHDLAAVAVRALVLYSLAEFQSGHATTIRVTAEGASFSVADDGRGHAIERAVGGAPYLKFIYTHLDYPFDLDQGAPIQLHGIGMSLLNALCSELSVTVQKPDATLRLSFRDGQLSGTDIVEVKSKETGNTIAGTIGPHIQKGSVSAQKLQQWLQSVLAACPSLKLLLNGQELQARHQGDA